jgi:ABC-2 type transport system permease protein
MRMVVLKGSSLYDIRFHLLYVFIFGIIVNGLAVFSYRKRS